MVTVSPQPEMPKKPSNVDPRVVEDFGNEWKTFNHEEVDEAALARVFAQYFDIFPFDKIDSGSVGFDMGCGSGRWAKFIAPRVGRLTLVDASPLALEQAKANLHAYPNAVFECASVCDSQIPPNSQDFGYCLGVLHHIPDTFQGIQACASKLKAGAPFLLYLYYRFDNKPLWFKAVWAASDILRRGVCRLPYPIKLCVTNFLAATVYWPLSRTAGFLEKLGISVAHFPLSDYRNKPFYFLRTDALDRFGTKLEKRFTKSEIEGMLQAAGFEAIRFSDCAPFWVALGFKT